MTPPHNPLTRILVGAFLIGFACQSLIMLLAHFGALLCVLLVLAIVARLVWFYTDRFR